MQINPDKAIQVLKSVQTAVRKPGPAANQGKAPDDSAHISDEALRLNLNHSSEAYGKLMDELASKIEELPGFILGESKAQAKADQAFHGDLDSLTKEKAQELLEGYFNAENTAQRIFDFAFSFFKGEGDRAAFAEEMKGHIYEGFDQAEKILGGLAPISLETRDLIDEMISDFVKAGEEESDASSEPKASASEA